MIDRPVDTERIGEEEQTQQTTGAFYSRILGAVIGANGIIKPSWAIIFIILAGFNYLTAKDDAEKIKSASKQLMLAAVAIAVVLMAFGFSTLIKSFIGP